MYVVCLVLNTQASGSRSVDLWCLLHEILADANFHNAVSGQQILKKLITEREDMLRNVAFRTARRSAESAFGPGLLMEEATEGYSSLIFHRELLNQVRENSGFRVLRLLLSFVFFKDNRLPYEIGSARRPQPIRARVTTVHKRVGMGYRRQSLLNANAVGAQTV